MNPTLVSIGLGFVMVFVTTPLWILASSYFNWTAVERGDVNRYTISILAPKAAVVAQSIAIAIYATEVGEFGWPKYLLVTFVPAFVSVSEVELLTPDLEDWHRVREFYLSYDGEGHWTDAFGEEGLPEDPS